MIYLKINIDHEQSQDIYREKIRTFPMCFLFVEWTKIHNIIHWCLHVYAMSKKFNILYLR